MMVSAAIEMATGLALIADPGFVIRVLLSADLSGSGSAVGRLTGIGLFCMGLACWPRNNGTVQTVFALFAYNLLAAIYLGYLRTGGGFVSYLLWPVCALHGVLALLLARTFIL